MRILLADDHTLLRQGLVLIIKEIFPHSHLQCNASWKEVEQTLNAHSFNLALLDIFMPSERIWEHELAFIVKQHPNLAICMLSSSCEQKHIETAFQLGAKGYLCKTATIDEIRQALLVVSQGEKYFPLQAWQCENFDHGLDLTCRQQEILKLMAQGKSAKSIARELRLSDNTVKSHIAAIYHTLNVTNRIEAINIARQTGLLGYY